MSSSAPSRPPHALEVGELVYIRYPLPRDREEFIALRKRSRDYLAPWEPRAPRGFNAFGDDQFDWLLKCRRKPDQERLLICELGTRVIVGQASLGAITRGPLQSAYLGYWIGLPFPGRGYMTDGVRLAVKHAFTTLGLHRVEANVQPHNAASIAVVKKAGFRLEGFSPKYLNIDGRWADHERWAMTVEDWRELCRAEPVPSIRSTRARSRPST